MNGLTTNNNVTVTIGGVTYSNFTVVPNGQSFDVVFGDSRESGLPALQS